MVDVKESIFLKTEYGVTVELRQSLTSRGKWIDWHAREWVQLADGMWQSTGFNTVLAKEIGRWSGSVDVYEGVRLASTNESGFRNWNPR